jgi:hypothetical protein
MYNDRELLALAAKAAGHTLGPDWDCLPEGIFINGDDRFSGTEWNPLTDDGDAFRLMAKLGLGVVFGQYAPCDIYSVYINEPEGGDTLSVGVIGDGEESGVIRRAIVRAAAAILEAMS